jgi:hypothetical protein
MKSWTGPLKQVVVAVVSLSLINATVPPPAMSLPSPPLHQVGHLPPFALGGPRNSRDFAKKTATIEVKPDLPGDSLKAVNDRNSNPTGLLTPPFDDQKPRVTRPAPPDSLPKRGERSDVTALGLHGLRFIENKGQWDERARFQVKSGQRTLWLTGSGVIFDNVRAKSVEQPKNPGPAVSRLSAPPAVQTYDRFVFSEDFVGGHPAPTIEPTNGQPGAYNYLVGKDSSKWHTGVHAFAGVLYRNVWDGVDVSVAGNGANIEQEFVVHPGADINRVQLAYRGIDGLEVEKDGSLLVHTGYGDLKETKPLIYQEIAGKRVSVAGRFRLTSESSYTFDVKPSQPQYALVIDPTLLYSTYLGGSGADQATGIAVDPTGSAYVTGSTSSTDFPTTTGVLQTTAGQSFVSKLAPLGNSLAYSTYLGNGARGYAIAVDSAGEAYVVGGFAGGDLPTTANAFQTGCGDSAFLTKLDATGSGLIYSTCLGSGQNGIYGTGVHAVAVDSLGRAYISGDGSSNLPTTAGAFQSQAASSSALNAYVAILDPSNTGASSLIYGSFLGGTNQCTQGDVGYGVAVDSFGMMYVAGVSSSLDFPVTANSFLTTFPASGQPCTLGAGYDRFSPFVAKFNPTATGTSSLIYSTFLGGPGYASAAGIAVDSSGSAYVVGYTSASSQFPTTAGSFLPTSTDGFDAFITKLNAAGNGLIYSTLLGGPQYGGGGTFAGANSYSQGKAIMLDQSGEAYVVGYTESGGFPTTPDAFQPTYPGGNGYNAFVSKLNATGSALVYSSYLGGTTGDQYAAGIAVDSAGDAYVVGFTSALAFPVTQSAYQVAFLGGGWDSFVTKFPIGAPVGLSITGIEPPVGGNSGSVTATVVGTGFEPSATLSLVCSGQPNIVASNVSVSLDGRTITGTFALTGTQAAGCSVVVANTDGTTVSDAGAFFIQQGGSPKMWVDIVGLSKVRGGAPENYYVVYGNTGNIDATGVVVSIEVPTALSWQLQPGQTPGYQIQQNGNLLRSFVVPRIPPQGSNAIIVNLTGVPLSGADVSVPFQFSAWINPY